VSAEPLDDLLARLDRERQAADRAYNTALTALDRALTPAAALPDLPRTSERSRLDTINGRATILPAGPPRHDRSLKGRVAGFVWRLVGPPLQQQAEFNSAVADHLNRSADAHDRWAGAALQLREAVQSELAALAQFKALLVQYLQTITAYVDTKDRNLAAGDVRERLGIAEQRLALLKREIDRLVERGSAVRPTTAAASPSVFSDPIESVTYVGFEDRHRGTGGEIRQRVEEYLPFLETAGNVVDVGCGRGELLAALRARGVRARGVDANAAMVETCRAQGLDAEQDDAVGFLARQNDGSVGGLAAIQVVEHFEPAYLVRFLATAYLKMSSGAPLVLETINAACWMAFFETYIRDLTHQRPLHPDTLRYLVEAAGFSAVDVRFRQPVSEGDRLSLVDPAALQALPPAAAPLASALNDHADKLNARLFSSMDYAVVARR
jgi:O-antigen chain-terminating methyltransferase